LPRQLRSRRAPLRVGLGLVLLASLCVPALASAGVRILPGKDEVPWRRADHLHRRTPVPCDDPVQELALTMSLTEAFLDSTEGDGVVDSYGCQPSLPLTGPEDLYVLTATEDLILDLGLASNVPNDHDLVLLSDCDSDSCLIQVNTELSAQLTAGTTVYLVVDGYDGAAGTYTLNLATRPVGIAESLCEGGAIDLPIPFETTVEAREDTLTGQPNLVSLYDCAPYTVRGGEVWYALSFAPADTDTVGSYGEYSTVTLTVSTAALDLDLALWVFADCGPEAQCLAFVDEGVAGAEEVLEWSNTTPEALTIYLAVDCIRAPDNGPAGAFTLDLDIATPARARDLSGLRNRFR
jgi:hypothetical protein